MVLRFLLPMAMPRCWRAAASGAWEPPLLFSFFFLGAILPSFEQENGHMTESLSTEPHLHKITTTDSQ